MTEITPLFSYTTCLKDVHHISSKECELLEKSGFLTVLDLLFYLPKRYEDRRRFDEFGALGQQKPVCLHVNVIDVRTKFAGAKRRYTEVLVEEKGMVKTRFSCIWFNMPMIGKMLCAGHELVLFGTAKKFGKNLCMLHPDFEVVKDDAYHSIHLERIVPVYGGRLGISIRRLREIIWGIFEKLDFSPESDVYEFVPEQTQKEALKLLHFPDSMEQAASMKRRFALEECLGIQLNVGIRRRMVQAKHGLKTASKTVLLKDLSEILPFELTAGQKQCIKEIFDDMRSPHVMNRLLQGDVGSGKTLVALCAMLLCVEHGFSAMMMAPTQILAEQHYQQFLCLLTPLGINVSLYTGDKRLDSHVGFKSDPRIIVGTHALLYAKDIEDQVGLVVIDEQHKFGVNQRASLIDRGELCPDVLVMTATPIPRTLTLTVYGDLDVSLLEQMPSGRGEMTTFVRPYAAMKKVVSFVKSQIDEGRQIYVVSPMIEGESKARSVAEDLAYWQKALPKYSVGLLHGKMSSDDKDQVMRDFKTNNIQILVSTTVVEVGVDVPNSTVMIINDAERFGLAQLHQLRGRIGRGEHPSYCILVTASDEESEEWAKLKILEETRNGFDLAEKDLQIRGPGDVLGTSQSGLKDVSFGDWIGDIRLIQRAQFLANKILDEDPQLSSKKYRSLRSLLQGDCQKAVIN